MEGQINELMTQHLTHNKSNILGMTLAIHVTCMATCVSHSHTETYKDKKDIHIIELE